MAGNTGRFVKRLEREMREAAGEQEYERAARLRDDIRALQRAMEKQAVVLGDNTDCDVIALAEDPLEAAVQVFYVRGGRIRGQRGWVVDKVEDASPGELVEQFLLQMYGDAAAEALPREVLVPVLPPDAEAVSELLGEHRGARVEIRVPQRGDKRSLMETVERNAEESLKQHKLKRASDLTARSRALQEIADALGPGPGAAPHRVLRRLPPPGHRRGGLHGGVRGRPGPQERVPQVLRALHRGRRRLHPRGDLPAVQALPGGALRHRGPATRTAWPNRARRPRTPGIDPETGKPRKFAYPPNLVVVDGGPAQVAAARRALDELGVDDVAVCGLAKRLEEVWLPGEDLPVILARSSEALYLLQRVRDEAHRFAITYHRSKRSKSVKESALDEVPGLGPARRQALIKHFGSVKRLREATAAQICEVPGIGPSTAETIVSALKGQNP